MKKLVVAVTAFLAWNLLSPAEEARAETRLALVIGNSAYQAVTALPNPANDARAVAEFLTTAGFEVGLAADLDQSNMRQAISDFAAKVASNGPDTVALVFYAGHGLQVDGDNYLVPVDAQIKREADVPMQAVRLADVMNALAAVPSKTRIVLLDACRNNPFSEINKVTGRGLAIVDAPTGSIVAYSTSPGSEAEDGTGNNSPFTSALLSVAREPGVPIEQAFKRVRLSVHDATTGRQTPWESSSLTSDFFFFSGPAGAAGSTAKKTGRVETKPVAAWRRELVKLKPQEAYDFVVREDSIEAYEAFLAVYGTPPLGPRVRGIAERRKEMVAWYVAVTVNTVASFQAFLASYPTSDLAATAQRLIERAQARSITPPPVANLGALAAVTPAAGCSCTPAKPEPKAKPKRERRAKAPPPRRGRGPSDSDIETGRAVPVGPQRGNNDAAAAAGIAIGIGSAIGGGFGGGRRDGPPAHQGPVRGGPMNHGR
ncbi:MAG: caspase family protein [Proteobacteria bacterium]|nr:caspase family protein [Pseudomonadota bacterium]